VSINGISIHIDIDLDEAKPRKIQALAENLRKIIGELDL